MVRISSSKVNSTYFLANNKRLSFRGMKTITVGCYHKAELVFGMYISDESFPFDSIYKIATYSISLFHLVSPRPALPRLHPPISRHWKMISYLLFVFHIMSRTEIRYLLCEEREWEAKKKKMPETFIDKYNYLKWDYDVGLHLIPIRAAWNLWQIEMIFSLSSIVRFIKIARAGKMNDVENQWNMEILLPLGSMTQMWFKCELHFVEWFNTCSDACFMLKLKT